MSSSGSLPASRPGRVGVLEGSRRSHPPSLRRLAARLISDEKLLAKGARVLCACSGGPDSSAMLHVLGLLRERFGLRLAAHGIDHGLRVEAPAELALAAELARSLDVPFAVTRVEVAPGPNVQARARAARLGALAAAARGMGAMIVATGHTADDRAETLLIRLLRGAGPRGLAVLPPSAPCPVPCSAGEASVSFVRPLLLARRADVLAHLQRHRVVFAQDPSNLDIRFLRVRVRCEVIPLLEQLSPEVVAHLCALAGMLTGLPGDAALAPFGRAQRQALERARRRGDASLRIRVRGGQDVAVTFPDGRIVLNEERRPGGEPPRKSSRARTP